MPAHNGLVNVFGDINRDEYYTPLSAIKNEFETGDKKHSHAPYPADTFAGKIVYCNCDDATWSNFWRYFYDNFESLGLKKLIATSYHDNTDKVNRLHGNTPAMKYEYYGNGDGSDEFEDAVLVTPLEGNGDFQSEECLDILDEADVVITNPPFSLFRPYISTLIKHNKKFAVIGNQNAITYKEIFPLIKENLIWEGYTAPKEFIKPDGSIKKFGNIMWFTNIDIEKRHQKIETITRYDPEKYPKYDNYDAIEVGHLEDIPCDYREEKIVTEEELERLRKNGFSVDILETIE